MNAHGKVALVPILQEGAKDKRLRSLLLLPHISGYHVVKHFTPLLLVYAVEIILWKTIVNIPNKFLALQAFSRVGEGLTTVRSYVKMLPKKTSELSSGHVLTDSSMTVLHNTVGNELQRYFVDRFLQQLYGCTKCRLTQALPIQKVDSRSLLGRVVRPPLTLLLFKSVECLMPDYSWCKPCANHHKRRSCSLRLVPSCKWEPVILANIVVAFRPIHLQTVGVVHIFLIMK